ncbi:MAG: hypothetical protein M3Q98_14775 [Actinomycetota bacterium]|nr:hypothetical protein [Actinomycetota bacterium]
MATTSFKETFGRKLLATGAAITVTSGLVGGAILMGSGASADSNTTTDTHSSVSADSNSVDSNVAKFRADLKDARALAGEARIEALQQIRQNAKAGEYGDKIEKRAENIDNRHARIWAHAPKELKDDLREIRKADPADRAELRHEIFTKAEAGEYGDLAKKHAEKLKQFVDGA